MSVTDQRARRRPRATGDRLVGLLQRHGQRQPGHPRRRDRAAATSASPGATRAPLQLLGYGLDDLRSLAARRTSSRPSRGGELKLLLRRERAARMTLPGPYRQRRLARVTRHRHAVARAAGCGPCASLSTANEQERALRATADAHERRFSTLTERSPVPTLLSEQGMRLAHVNDAFCIAGRPARRAAARHRLDRHRPPRRPRRRHRAGRRRPRGRRGRDPGPPRPRRRQRADDGHPLRPPLHPGRRRRLRRHDRGHHRPAGLRGEARPPGQPRPADRAAQPDAAGAVRRRAGSCPAQAAWPASSSTWTTSRSSTTRSATPPATSCSSRSPTGCAPPCAPATWSPGSAATSSSSSARTSTRPTPSRWPSGSSIALARPMRLGGVDIRPVRQRRRHRADRRARRGRGARSATATSPCTRRRPAARGGSPSSTSRPVPRRATSCGWSPTCATPSSSREITLYYQPIFSTATGHAVAVESLARWQHAERGRDQPGDLRAAGRGERPDRRARSARARRDLPPGGRVGPACSGDAAPPRANVNVSALQLDDNLPVPGRRRPGPAQAGAVADLDRDHRVGPDEGPGVGPRGARSSCATWVSSWPSTTSAPATRRWPTCATCRWTA